MRGRLTSHKHCKRWSVKNLPAWFLLVFVWSGLCWTTVPLPSCLANRIDLKKTRHSHVFLKGFWGTKIHELMSCSWWFLFHRYWLVWWNLQSQTSWWLFPSSKYLDAQGLVGQVENRRISDDVPTSKLSFNMASWKITIIYTYIYILYINRRYIFNWFNWLFYHCHVSFLGWWKPCCWTREETCWSSNALRMLQTTNHDQPGII